MARENVESVMQQGCVVRASQVPFTSPGNLQCALEFWIQSETTPLLTKGSVTPLPPAELPVTHTQHPQEKKEEKKENDKEEKEKQEDDQSSWTIAYQVFLPFVIAGFGTVAAGLLLDAVQHWTVFQAVPEMFVLVPALLGLKGNLEMTLASRISTLANLGSIDSKKEQWKMALGNLALLQCQSLVLGLVASAMAWGVGWIREGEANPHSALLLASSSLVTASVASLLLGSLTIAVVIASRRLGMDPDNVAAPLSASLGDVITLGLLACVATFNFGLAERLLWVEGVVVAGLVLLAPLWGLIAYRNPYTRHALLAGWIPVLSAVAISSGGGYILNSAVGSFKEIAACQPVINGVGGNLVAVQACRISTFLHRRRAKPGPEPPKEVICLSPCAAWFGPGVHSRTCRVLVLLAVPGHLLFVSCVHLLKGSSASLTPLFLSLYLCAALLQVALLLYLAHCLVHGLWRLGLDPDDAAIPYLTALGDLLGTALLFVAFLLLRHLS